MVAPSSGAASSGVTASPRNRERTARVLMLDPLDSRGFEEPVVLDQITTYLRFSSAGAASSGQVVIERIDLGWRLRAKGSGCLLNDGPVGEAWLHEGDRLMMSNTEFRVRPATTEELLEYLPRLGQQPESPHPGQQPESTAPASDQDLGIAARERDLADWEQCLAECEADIQAQEATIGQRAAARPDLTAAWVLDELEGLRSDQAALDADRRRLEERMAELKRHRAILQAEREQLAADRATLARAQPAETGAAPARGAAPVAEEAEAVISSLSATIAAEIAEDAPAAVPERRRPPQELMESRVRRNTLRQVVNQSTRRTLSRHFWKKHRSTVVLKMALVAMSFALAGVLYWNHGALGSPASTVAWGAAAIGLITISGLVHTLSEINRLNGGARMEMAGDDHPSGPSLTP